MPTRIQLLTRKRCHLCDEALAVLEPACRARSLAYEKIDIDEVSGFQQYSEEIPVLLVDGKKIFKYRFPAKKLARVLDRNIHREGANARKQKLL